MPVNSQFRIRLFLEELPKISFAAPRKPVDLACSIASAIAPRCKTGERKAKLSLCRTPDHPCTISWTTNGSSTRRHKLAPVVRLTKRRSRSNRTRGSPHISELFASRAARAISAEGVCSTGLPEAACKRLRIGSQFPHASFTAFSTSSVNVLFQLPPRRCQTRTSR